MYGEGVSEVNGCDWESIFQPLRTIQYYYNFFTFLEWIETTYVIEVLAIKLASIRIRKFYGHKNIYPRKLLLRV
jgi:hypothetical protein